MNYAWAVLLFRGKAASNRMSTESHCLTLNLFMSPTGQHEMLMFELDQITGGKDFWDPHLLMGKKTNKRSIKTWISGQDEQLIVNPTKIL